MTSDLRSDESLVAASGAETSGEVWTVMALLRWTTDYFAKQGIDSPRLDAECLLAFALDCDRVALYVEYAKPVVEAERSRFRELVQRRARERVPVAQLLGRREFWSLSFEVTSDVLTPRPETETLVAALLERIASSPESTRVLELGTGSGCIAIALARECPRLEITATDISDAALCVAKRNAARLEVADRIDFRRGDLLAPVAGEHFDWIVSNPPYLARDEAETLPPELASEPDGALFGGADGLEITRRIWQEAPAALAAGGRILLEVGLGQADAVCGGFRGVGLSNCEVVSDLSHCPRVIVASRA